MEESIAAKIENKASLYKRQGEMLFQAEKYSQAAVVLSKALDLNVKKKGSVNITLMQAYFYLIKLNIFPKRTQCSDFLRNNQNM